MSEGISSSRKFLLFVIILFLIALPKGGIKMAGIPLTWSYLLLGFCGIGTVLLSLSMRQPQVLHQKRLYSFFLTLPFGFFYLIAVVMLGFLKTGYVVSVFINALILPALLVLIWGMILDQGGLTYLGKVLKYCILFTAIFGIFLFFYKQLTGEFFVIPYLTVNADDYQLLAQKHIQRGSVTKLISTYNNGNIYGVCMLMLLPLYRILLPRLIYQIPLLIALVLTFSRTVWVGLVIIDLLYLVFVERVRIRAIAARLLLLFTSVVGIYFILQHYGFGVDFLLDYSLGGRIDQFESLWNFTLFPDQPFDHTEEVLYPSILHSFGVLGLLLFIVAMNAPVLVFVIYNPSQVLLQEKRALLVGLIGYQILSFSDGAFINIPVIGIYWLIATLLLSDRLILPTEREDECEEDDLHIQPE
jgi:hypothetical protein